MTKTRIYAVSVNMPDAKVRLIEAANAAQARAFVADGILRASLPSQRELIEYGKAGVPIEDANDEPSGVTARADAAPVATAGAFVQEPFVQEPIALPVDADAFEAARIKAGWRSGSVSGDRRKTRAAE